ncbi:MAG TPA: hypothetical protein VN457_04065, partial [Chlamydiales bacterium]|nr:hypothetical protein [Chlamydiales bacterium]
MVQPLTEPLINSQHPSLFVTVDTQPVVSVLPQIATLSNAPAMDEAASVIASSTPDSDSSSISSTLYAIPVQVAFVARKVGNYVYYFFVIVIPETYYYVKDSVVY